MRSVQGPNANPNPEADKDTNAGTESSTDEEAHFRAVAIADEEANDSPSHGGLVFRRHQEWRRDVGGLWRPRLQPMRNRKRVPEQLRL